MKKILLPIVLFLSIFTYQITSAVSNPLDNPLINISDFQYKGAFVPSGDSGSGSLNSSLGRIAVDSDNNSIFLSGHRTQGDGIGEYIIPELRIEDDYNLLNKGNQIQDLTSFLHKVPNPEEHDEIGGMQIMSGALVVSSYRYYDGSADNIKNTSIFRNKSDLGNSLIDGIFGIEGKDHLALWLSYIPLEWQSLLGGDYIGGGSNAIPINGRSSMGPSAFSFSGSELLNSIDTGIIISSNKLLDFNLSHILADTLLGWINLSGWEDGLKYNYAVTIPQATDYSNNYDIGLVGTGTLWTEYSSALYGFVVPGTRTYATIGPSGMHNSGGGYKIIDKDGTLCSGSCPYDPTDSYNYMWLWDIADLVDVKKGLKLAHEVKPYEYGIFNTPYEFKIDGKSKNLIGGGDYDYINNKLYLTLPSAYKKTAYSYTPIILAYDISVPITDEIGEYFITHMENIPNPAYNSTFRVSDICKGITNPCNWEDTTTWSEGVLPGLETKVIIDGKVQINNTGSIAKHVVIYPNGELYFNPNVNTKLFTGDLIVGPDGYLEIGTETTPVNGNVTAEVVIRDFAFESNDIKQHGRAFLSQDGKIRIHGEEKTETFIRVTKEMFVGETTINLEESALNAGWKVGDTIIIPQSSPCISDFGVCRDRTINFSQTEDNIITNISGDGLTITIDSPLINDHLGGKNSEGIVDTFPHIINNSRNVIIRSENPNGIRGHTLFHSKSDIDVRYAKFFEMGRTNIDYVGSFQNIKARYPLHMHHLIGPDLPQTNGYQFTLLGNVIDFGINNDELEKKWGIVVHASHYGLIEQNIVDKASGSSIVTEDGSEKGNMFRKNFAVRLVGGAGNRNEEFNDPNFYNDNEDGFNDKSKLGRVGAAFWFNGGGANFIEDNVVSDTYKMSYKFDNIYTGLVKMPINQGDNPHMEGQYEEVYSYAIGLSHFERNEAYGVPSGLTYWWFCSLSSNEAIFENGCQNIIKDFKIWNHYAGGIFGYPATNTIIDGFVTRGDVRKFGSVYKPKSGGIGFDDYLTKNLLIKNSDIAGTYFGIVLPSFVSNHLGDKLEILDNTVTKVENTTICSRESVVNHIVWGVGNGNARASKRSVLDNVSGCSDFPLRVMMKQRGRGNDYNDNLEARNEVVLKNYSYSGTTHDLFIIPNYQDDSYCDSSLAECGLDVSSDYPLIELGKVYKLKEVPIEVCTTSTYSDWGVCTQDNIQTRIELLSLPNGCGGGTTEPLVQSCTYVAPQDEVCTSFTYSDWGTCDIDALQARTILTSLPNSCTGGTPEVLIQSCTHIPIEPTICTNFTYSDWGVCSSENTQARIILTSLPGSCTGGTPESLVQSCSYVAPVVKRSGGGGGGGGSRAKTCLDTQLICKQNKAQTRYLWYRKAGVSCTHKLLGDECSLENLTNTGTNIVKISDNILITKGYLSTNKVINKFAKKLDEKVINNFKADNEEIIELRNKIIKSLDDFMFISLSNDSAGIKKIKKEIIKKGILKNYKNFLFDVVKKEKVQKEQITSQSTSIGGNTNLNGKLNKKIGSLERLNSENKAINKFANKLDKKIDDANKNNDKIIVSYRNKIIGFLDSYIRVKIFNSPATIKKMKLKILEKNILNSYKNFLNNLK